MENDDPIILTPLVIGLTRPPMMIGIPFNAFIFIIGITVIAFLIFNSFWAVAIAPLAYLILFSLCSYDVRVLDVIQVAGAKTPRIPNKTLWGTNTYSQ